MTQLLQQKLKPQKLSDIILAKLEDLIVDGSLQPGEKLLPERELAKKFEVSRPSLREAIQKLEAKGLVTRKQGGGTFVSKKIMKSFKDINKKETESIKTKNIEKLLITIIYFENYFLWFLFGLQIN